MNIGWSSKITKTKKTEIKINKLKQNSNIKKLTKHHKLLKLKIFKYMFIQNINKLYKSI